MEQIWNFIKTLSKGIVQGINQFISNDLQSYIPFFIIAAVIIVAALLKGIIGKFNKK
jgi:hypothetical protein